MYFEILYEFSQNRNNASTKSNATSTTNFVRSWIVVFFVWHRTTTTMTMTMLYTIMLVYEVRCSLWVHGFFFSALCFIIIFRWCQIKPLTNQMHSLNSHKIISNLIETLVWTYKYTNTNVHKTPTILQSWKQILTQNVTYWNIWEHFICIYFRRFFFKFEWFFFFSIDKQFFSQKTKIVHNRMCSLKFCGQTKNKQQRHN